MLYFLLLFLLSCDVSCRTKKTWLASYSSFSSYPSEPQSKVDVDLTFHFVPEKFDRLVTELTFLSYHLLDRVSYFFSHPPVQLFFLLLFSLLPVHRSWPLVRCSNNYPPVFPSLLPFCPLCPSSPLLSFPPDLFLPPARQPGGVVHGPWQQVVPQREGRTDPSPSRPNWAVHGDRVVLQEAQTVLHPSLRHQGKPQEIFLMWVLFSLTDKTFSLSNKCFESSSSRKVFCKTLILFHIQECVMKCFLYAGVIFYKACLHTAEMYVLIFLIFFSFSFVVEMHLLDFPFFFSFHICCY